MTDRSDILERFTKLRIWRRGAETAPHKPLLLLYALGRAARGGERLIPFTEVDEYLGRLLRDFGPARKSIHPEYPFWRLQNDRIWEVRTAHPTRPRASNSDPPKRELINADARGGFILEIDAALRQDSALIQALAEMILNRAFPPEVHDDLRAATGLED